MTVKEHIAPIEVRIFNGVEYSIAITANPLGFFILFVSEHHTKVSVECPDLRLEDISEIYERAHRYAEKIINVRLI